MYLIPANYFTSLILLYNQTDAAQCNPTNMAEGMLEPMEAEGMLSCFYVL